MCGLGVILPGLDSVRIPTVLPGVPGRVGHRIHSAVFVSCLGVDRFGSSDLSQGRCPSCALDLREEMLAIIIVGVAVWGRCGRRP